MPQAFQELDLTGMIQVVCRNSGEQIEITDLRSTRRRGQNAALEPRDLGTKPLVRGLEERDVLAPG